MPHSWHLFISCEPCCSHQCLRRPYHIHYSISETFCIFFAADIDFSVNTDDFGDWKIGSDCNSEENSGPCYDMSASAKPSMLSNSLTIFSRGCKQNDMPQIFELWLAVICFSYMGYRGMYQRCPQLLGVGAHYLYSIAMSRI